MTPMELTAASFVERLQALQSDDELRKIQRFFKTGAGDYGEGDVFMGVRMGSIFELAKIYIDMAPDEIEMLLASPIHEHRVGALSIMGKQARRKKTTAERKQALFDLYLRRHDRINNWDLVDLAAHQVIGGHLTDRPREILYSLARSPSLWERRTAMLATWAFIREGHLDDAYAIAEILLNDKQDLIHKVVGWMLRAAGDVDRDRLLAFLDAHAATMPRTMLRASIEKLLEDQRRHYLVLKTATPRPSRPAE
jgi:hypothetical protein